MKRPLDRALLLWKALVVACDGDEADALDTLICEAPAHGAGSSPPSPERTSPMPSAQPAGGPR